MKELAMQRVNQKSALIRSSIHGPHMHTWQTNDEIDYRHRPKPGNQGGVEGFTLILWLLGIASLLVIVPCITCMILARAGCLGRLAYVKIDPNKKKGGDNRSKGRNEAPFGNGNYGGGVGA
mmetsp:Transcript_8627/g.25200  ORF Transcript_8627/g.25200 Transcript_8627/m.25200 type:complete len:121 (+) Transcript_8627:178-540(+)